MRGFIILTWAETPPVGGMRVQVRTISEYHPRVAAKGGKIIGSTITLGGVSRDVTETVDEIDQLIRNQKP